MSRDEQKAVAFLGLVLVLAAGVRVAGQPQPWQPDLPAVPVESLAVAVRQEDAAARRRKRPLADGERIDVNSASAAELDRLPGIGPALAERIVAVRDSAGPFGGPADLRRVRGFGAGILAKTRAHIDFVPGGEIGALPRVSRAPPPPAATPPTTIPAARSERAHGTVGVETPLDPNRATAAELEALPGVGPALAARIVAYRDSAGAFRTLADMRGVRGIGPVLLERLRPRIALPP